MEVAFFSQIQEGPGRSGATVERKCKFSLVLLHCFTNRTYIMIFFSLFGSLFCTNGSLAHFFSWALQATRILAPTHTTNVPNQLNRWGQHFNVLRVLLGWLLSLTDVR